MPDIARLKKRVRELADRDWDVPAIEAKLKKLTAAGIPKKKLEPKAMLANKDEIIQRVQRRAEDYNFIMKNCPQGTALALFEEFGVGSMEIIKALTPFPGIAGTGKVCGGVTGSLITFGLYFGSDDRMDYETTGQVIGLSQEFLSAFEQELGTIMCSDIIESVTIGHKINPGESPEAMHTFASEKGFEKCGLPPAVGAGLCAEFIIDKTAEHAGLLG